MRPAPVLLLAALALAAPASAQREPPDPLFVPAEMPTGRGWFCFTHRRASRCFRRAGLCGDTRSSAIAPHAQVAYSCGPPRTTAHCLRVEWRWGPYVRCAPTAALCRAERRRLTTPPPPHQPNTPDLPPPTGVSRCHAVGDVPSRASTAQGDAQPEG